jgi:hypothetical protein
MGRSRRNLEDNIEMYLQEVGWGSVVWIYLARDKKRWQALASVVMNPRVA